MIKKIAILSFLIVSIFAQDFNNEQVKKEDVKIGIYEKLGDIVENLEFNEKLTKPTISKIIQKFLPLNEIKPLIDDRMFVISFYQNSAFADELKQDFVQNDRWYEYVFVD